MHETVNEKELKMREKFQKCDEKVVGGRGCGARFDSPIDLVKHFWRVHGHPETYSPLIAAVVELEGPAFTSLDGNLVFTKLATYKKDRFCILHVLEFKFWVRIWVTEADPKVNRRNKVPIKITVPAPDLEGHAQHEQLYQFTGKILPFGTYRFKWDDPMEYFDVPKSFLRQYYERKDNGRVGISILFAIGMFDAKQVFSEDQEKLVIIRIKEEGQGQDSVEGSQDEAGPETASISTSSSVSSAAEEEEDDDDDDAVIVRPIYEIYE